MRINKKGKFKYLGIEDRKKFAASTYIDFGVIETAIARYSPALVDAVADSSRLDVHLHGGRSAGPEHPFEFVVEHDDLGDGVGPSAVGPRFPSG